MSERNPQVYYNCAYCGRPAQKAKRDGKPPMTPCAANKGKPHRWIKIKEF